MYLTKLLHNLGNEEESTGKNVENSSKVIISSRVEEESTGENIENVPM